MSMLSALVVSVATLGASSEATAPGFPEVVSIQRISGDSPFDAACGDPDGTAIVDSEVEVHLAVDPSDPDHLMASWQQDRHASGGAARSHVLAVSRDGGAHWNSPITVPGISTCTDDLSPFDRVTDPWGAIGPDGTAYLSSLAIDEDAEDGPGPEEDDAVFVSVSQDGGETWHALPSTLEAGEHFLEKPVITAHPTRPGVVYAVWAREEQDPLTGQRVDDQMRFAISEDGGAEWTVPTTIPPDDPVLWEWPMDVTVIPQTHGGTRLVVVFRVWDKLHREQGTPGTYRLYSVTWDDSSETWSDPSPIAMYVKSMFRGDAEEIVQFAHGVPDVAVAPDGTIYAAWSQDSAAGAGPGGTEIRVAHSVDQGRSWEAPTTVTSVDNIAEIPAIAVAGDGTVGVSWYDVRNDAPGDDELTTDVWFATSSDRGAVWSESHLAGPFDLRRAPRDSDGLRYFLGDYVGLVGLPDGFGALFPMAPPVAEHGPSDAFFARMSLPESGPGKVTGSGSVPGDGGHGAATFDLGVHSDGAGNLKGRFTVDDPSAGVRIEATSLTSLLIQDTRDGLRCTIRGHGQVARGDSVNSEPFTATCVDGGPGQDTLDVESGSYVGGGSLTSGNITIHG